MRKCPRGSVAAEGASMGPVHQASSSDWRTALDESSCAIAGQDSMASNIAALCMAWRNSKPFAGMAIRLPRISAGHCLRNTAAPYGILEAPLYVPVTIPLSRHSGPLFRQVYLGLRA